MKRVGIVYLITEAPEAKGALFPEGEERNALALLFETHYKERFGGAE